jgi:hypothetical protein
MIWMLLATPAITWVKVDRPRFDLVGVVLGALGLAGALAVLAMVLGVVLGAAFIVRRRRHQRSIDDGVLHLDLLAR